MDSAFRYTLICVVFVATSVSTASAASGNSQKPLRGKPDFGGVTTKYVEVSASGKTLESAVDNAIRLAIEQVNGQRLDSVALKMEAGTSLEAKEHSVDVNSSAYAKLVASKTSGIVTNFHILSRKQVNNPIISDVEKRKASRGRSWNRGAIKESQKASGKAAHKASVKAFREASGKASVSYEQLPAREKEKILAIGKEKISGREKEKVSAKKSKKLKLKWDQQEGASRLSYIKKHTEYSAFWTVRIAANVATYREARSAKRTRIIVAQPRVTTHNYQVGDETIKSSTIATAIQSKLVEALTQAHRFTVLDRKANAEVAHELSLIQSGKSTSADAARLGQQLASDLIVIPSIEKFKYVRHERKLRLADRTLVSYSGAGEVSFRLVNAVTGQITMSKSFDFEFPSTSPTTLGTSVDGNKLVSEMMKDVSKNIISTILRKSFPLSVVRVSGKRVIINQGGDAVQKGSVFSAVRLGKPIIDPTTGQSLGPTETLCCKIAIDRVTPKLSYGHIVGKGIKIKTPYKPGSIELRGEVAAKSKDRASARAEASIQKNSQAQYRSHTYKKAQSQTGARIQKNAESNNFDNDQW